MAASPAATVVSGSRRRLLAVRAQAVRLAWPAASGAVRGRLVRYGGCGCYGGLAGAGADRDVLGARLGRLGYQDLQDAVVGCGFDRVGHHVAGQGDRAAERAVAALGPVDLLCGGGVARGSRRPARLAALPADCVPRPRPPP